MLDGEATNSGAVSRPLYPYSLSLLLLAVYPLPQVV